jgi:hypothetical protein
MPLYDVFDNCESVATEPNRLLKFYLSCCGLVRETSQWGLRVIVSRKMAEFYLVTRKAMQTALRRWRQRRGLAHVIGPRAERSTRTSPCVQRWQVIRALSQLSPVSSPV